MKKKVRKKKGIKIGFMKWKNDMECEGREEMRCFVKYCKMNYRLEWIRI